jgi:hypothetical protein
MAEKYQHILSFLDQSSSSSQLESDERVTGRSLRINCRGPHRFFPHSLGINGAILLHHIEPGKGFSGRHDAGFQRVAQRPGVQIADHRARDFNAT